MSRYADAANPDLVVRIPLTARSVLDVGCGTAALGAEYKARNPAARYLGIELDTEAARIAAGRIDGVAGCDVESQPLPFGNEPVDCLIYGDVLEHLREPWSVLTRQVEALAPGGTVLACIPNVDHWSFAEHLLRGSFDYEAEGLFDRTHLRWFSLETASRALRAAGLEPCEIVPRVFRPERAEPWLHAIRPALESLGIDPRSYLTRALPLQFVWRAQRRLPSRIVVTGTALPAVGGVSEVRVQEPMRALASDASILPRVVERIDEAADPPDLPRIFVLHRPRLTGEDGFAVVRYLIDRGYVVVCEFDDHPDYIPVLQGIDVLNFRAVHAVQTSTPALAAVLRRENPEVAVFPNAIARLPQPRNFADPDGMTLFFGGLNREQDWPDLMPALNAAAAAAGPRLRFRVVADHGFFEALRTPHKHFTPICDYDAYRGLLGGCEISFMPLADTPFNRCKSDLKFLEAASHGLAAVASEVAYGASIEDGVTGLIFRDGQELYDRLMRLVASPATARAMGEAARAHVAAQRMLAYQVGARAAWYRDLWARREELHAALLARVPELAG